MPPTPRPRLTRRLVNAIASMTRRVDVQPQPLAVPVVMAPAPSPSMLGKAVRKRLDTIRNSILGFGEDKVSASRPDIYRIPLAFPELTAAWRYGGLARRFVEAIPNDATRKGWHLTAEGKPLAEMDEENKRLDIFSEVADADKWGRLYGGAWILIVTTDDMSLTPFEDAEDKSAWLQRPLDLRRVKTLDNLVVLDADDVTPLLYDGDFRSPGFRQPLTYRIHASAGGPTRKALMGEVVHASRMVYFPGAKLPALERQRNRGIDDSVLEAVWDQIRNSETTSHALAAIASELKITAVRCDTAGMGVGDEAEFFDLRMRRMALHKSILNSVLLAKDEEYQHHPGTVGGMGELTATMRQDLQAVTGMPEQLWLGNAPGGLSTDGESHRNLWANVISSYQTVKYLSCLVQIYEVVFAAREGPFRGITPEAWEVVFNPLDEPTQAGIADQRKVVAETDNLYVMMGALDPQHVAKGRFGEDGWQDELPPIDESGFGDLDVNIGGILEGIGTAGGTTGGVAAPGAPPVPGAPVGTQDSDLGLEERRNLAAEMTRHGVARCQHGGVNRCRICGIERARGLQVGPDGQLLLGEEGETQWLLQWRAIGDIPAVEEEGGEE